MSRISAKVILVGLSMLPPHRAFKSASRIPIYC
jgi:hypothetical protein